MLLRFHSTHSHGLHSLRNNHKIDMLNGSLLDKILVFALPLAVSTIFQQLFNSADVAVVGRFDSSQALAAVGSNGSAINLLVNLFVGLSVGANVVVAKYIGQSKPDKIREVIHTVISLALISGFLLLAWGLIMARPLLTIMRTPPDVMELSVLYLRLYFIGMPFIMIYNFGAAILRSMGDSRRPLWCLLISGVINVVLNLILVIVFKLSVAGVAVATVISNAVSAWMVLRYLMNEDDPFRLKMSCLTMQKSHLLLVLRIGVPAGVQGMLFSLSNMSIQSAINSFGSSASAGSAAALNFDFITFYFVSAFAQAAVTFTSQNYGAGNVARCRRVFSLTMLSGLFFTGLACLGCVVFQREILSLYTIDHVVLSYAEVRMVHAVAFIWLCCTYEICGGCLRGMGHSILPTAFVLIGCCALRFVWVYAVFPIWGSSGGLSSFARLMDVYPISWIITGTATLTAYYRVRGKAFGIFEKTES